MPSFGLNASRFWAASCGLKSYLSLFFGRLLLVSANAFLLLLQHPCIKVSDLVLEDASPSRQI